MPGSWRVFAIPVTGRMTAESLSESVELFRKLYLRRFTFDLGEREVEIHGINVTGTGISDKYRPQPAPPASARPAVPDSRPVYWREAEGWADTPVWSRPGLPVGFETVGPAVVEQMDSTTLVPPGMGMAVDRYLNLVIDTTGTGGAADERPAVRTGSQAGVVDPVTFSILSSAFVSLVDEMVGALRDACLSFVIYCGDVSGGTVERPRRAGGAGHPGRGGARGSAPAQHQVGDRGLRRRRGRHRGGGTCSPSTSPTGEGPTFPT